MRSSPKNTSTGLKKWLKITVKSLLGLAISVVLTVMAVAFIPSAFKFGLDITVDLLPKDKFTFYPVSNKKELSEHFGIGSASDNDEALLDEIASTFELTKNRDTFFANMFVALDNAPTCHLTYVGKHRLYDIAWVLDRKECRKPKHCEGEQCDDKRRDK